MNAFYVCVEHHIRSNIYLILFDHTIQKSRFCQPYFSNEKTEMQGGYVVFPKLAVWRLAEHFNTVTPTSRLFQVHYVPNDTRSKQEQLLAHVCPWCYRLNSTPAS